MECWQGKPGAAKPADVRRRGVRAYLCQAYGWHPIRDREKIRRWLPKVYAAYIKRHGQWNNGVGLFKRRGERPGS
jgi:hypothetical protein